ncbi:MAG: M23 family metallopeptidase [Allosphingosinicella sp.]
MHPLPLFLIALAAAPLIPAAGQPEGPSVQIVPAQPLYAEPLGSGADLMLQDIVLANPGPAPVEVRSIRIQFTQADRARTSHEIDVGEFVASSQELAGMASQGMAPLVAGQLLDERGAAAFGGAGASFSTDARLDGGELLVATSRYFALPYAPDGLRIEVAYTMADGHERTAAASSPIVVRPARLGYTLPVRGPWNMRGLAGARSHHRRIASNEFALDFFRLGANGAISDGDSLVAENSFGYGEPVLAAADGEVVAVIADETQDRTVYTVRAGETRETAGRRIQQYQMARMGGDFRGALAGNLITLRHDFPDGRVEYSSYGHLAAGSVRVAVGDRVTRGQLIGGVGDTGDSSVVHLHFQLNAGPDPFFSRSLPVRFDNMRETFGGQDAGIFITTAE